MVEVMSSETKNVQTELDRSEYLRLRELAAEEGISIKEAVRRATIAWIDRRDAIHEDDALFSFHEDYVVPTTGPTDPDSLDDELYGEEA